MSYDYLDSSGGKDMSGQWYDRKKAGVCVECGVNPPVSKRGLLCERCLAAVAKRNAENK